MAGHCLGMPRAAGHREDTDPSACLRDAQPGQPSSIGLQEFIFTQPCCQRGRVTSAELIKRRPKYWCQLLLVISAPRSFPLWHIKRSRRI